LINGIEASANRTISGQPVTIGRAEQGCNFSITNSKIITFGSTTVEDLDDDPANLSIGAGSKLTTGDLTINCSWTMASGTVDVVGSVTVNTVTVEAWGGAITVEGDLTITSGAAIQGAALQIDGGTVSVENDLHLNNGSLDVLEGRLSVTGHTIFDASTYKNTIDIELSDALHPVALGSVIFPDESAWQPVAGWENKLILEDALNATSLDGLYMGYKNQTVIVKSEASCGSVFVTCANLGALGEGEIAPHITVSGGATAHFTDDITLEGDDNVTPILDINTGATATFDSYLQASGTEINLSGSMTIDGYITLGAFGNEEPATMSVTNGGIYFISREENDPVISYVYVTNGSVLGLGSVSTTATVQRHASADIN